MPATRFTIADVKRAVVGAVASGEPVKHIDVLPDGTIRIALQVDKPAESPPSGSPKEW